MPQADISFNYLGQLERGQTQTGQFRVAAESSGPLQSQLGSRPHLLAISGVVANEQLSLNIEYSHQQYHPATIEQLAQTYASNLRSLIQHCLSEEAGGYTPSDFPLAPVSQQQLDKFLGKTKREKQA
jgi:microcystin synthetase protein McyA